MISGDELSKLLSLRDMEELKKEVAKMSEQDAKNMLVALLTTWNQDRLGKA